MTRRFLVVLVTLAGLAGVLVAIATPASAQVGLPGIDLAGLLRSIFDSFPPFLRSILGPIFNALLSFFGGGCIQPFCASP